VIGFLNSASAGPARPAAARSKGKAE
jgi:hypothetical protein